MTSEDYTCGWLQGYEWALTNLQDEGVVRDMLRLVSAKQTRDQTERQAAERLVWNTHVN